MFHRTVLGAGKDTVGAKPGAPYSWRIVIARVVYSEIKASLFVYSEVGVRGCPNGIFDPWVRWDGGLGPAKNSSAAVIRHRRARVGPGPGPGVVQGERSELRHILAP